MSAIHGVNYGTPTLDLNFAKNKSLIDTVSGLNLVTFTRGSIGTYVGADGLIKTAVANEARFDHNPVTGVCNGLLVEEARTNLIITSIPENGLTRHNGIFSGNAAIAPDGTLTASLVTTGAFSSRFGWYNNYGSIPISGGTGVISFYAKSNGSPWVGVACGLGSPWNYSNAAYNLVTGASRTYITNTHGYQFKRATSVGNGWFRVEFDVITPSNSIPKDYLMFNTALSGSNGDLVNSFAGDGVSGAYFWGLQIESGSFATSLIPTSGSTVTRSADSASITGTNFSRWYNQNEGTFSANLLPIEPVNDGSGFGTIFLDLQGDGFVLQSRVGSSYAIRSNHPSFNSILIGTVDNKLRFSIGISADGSTSISRSSSLPIVNTVTIGTSTKTGLLIGDGSRLGTWGAGGTGSCVFSRLTYYPTRLQDSQLQQLTK